jgi:hypothetical protein
MPVLYLHRGRTKFPRSLVRADWKTKSNVNLAEFADGFSRLFSTGLKELNDWPHQLVTLFMR